MPGRNDAAPHICTGHFDDGRPCTNPAYIGFGLAARCVQRGCINYDPGLWAEWVMLLDDDGMPEDSEPDFFDDEDTPTYGITFNGIPVKGAPSANWQPYGQPTKIGLALAAQKQLDDWGAVCGIQRHPGETDSAYRLRLLSHLTGKP